MKLKFAAALIALAALAVIGQSTKREKPVQPNVYYENVVG